MLLENVAIRCTLTMFRSYLKHIELKKWKSQRNKKKEINIKIQRLTEFFSGFFRFWASILVFKKF